MNAPYLSVYAIVAPNEPPTTRQVEQIRAQVQVLFDGLEKWKLQVPEHQDWFHKENLPKDVRDYLGPVAALNNPYEAEAYLHPIKGWDHVFLGATRCYEDLHKLWNGQQWPSPDNKFWDTHVRPVEEFKIRIIVAGDTVTEDAPEGPGYTLLHVMETFRILDILNWR